MRLKTYLFPRQPLYRRLPLLPTDFILEETSEPLRPTLNERAIMAAPAARTPENAQRLLSRYNTVSAAIQAGRRRRRPWHSVSKFVRRVIALWR